MGEQAEQVRTSRAEAARAVRPAAPLRCGSGAAGGGCSVDAPTRSLPGEQTSVPHAERIAQMHAAPGVRALQAEQQRANAGPHAASLARLQAVVAGRADANGGTAGVAQRMYKRPAFTSDSKKSAIMWHNTRPDRPFEIDEKTPDLPSHNAAMPHRMAWKEIRDSTKRFHKGDEDAADFVRWTDRFVTAGEERIAIIQDQIATEGDSDELQELLARARSSQASFIEARDEYVLTEDAPEGKEFLRQANSFHANVPDFGPHRGVNNPVREAGHLHFTEPRGRKRTRSPSPMSRQLLDMSPERLPTGLAFQDDENLIATTGETVSRDELSPSTLARVDLFPQKIVRSFDPDAAFGSSSATTSAPPPKKAKRSHGGGKKKSTKSRRSKAKVRGRR